MLGRLYAPIRKVTNRPRVGTPRAKWLNKLEEEENNKVLTRFEKKHTKGCYKAVIIRYFLIDRLYIVT